MRILINATNIKQGGGLQVVDSLCRSLIEFPQHQFIVVLCSRLDKTASLLEVYPNVVLKLYDIKNSFSTLLLGRDKYLDNVVRDNRVECVLTVFGPSRWNPKCRHISGFARSQLVCPESPFFSRMTWDERLLSSIYNTVIHHLFSRSTRVFFSESSWISRRVEESFKGCTCATVTNYYNQVFDNREQWVDCLLPSFDGVTFLNIGADYPHKNLRISFDIVRTLKTRRPGFKFRFVFTLSESEFDLPDDVKEFFFLVGRVDISQCPSLYEQSNIMFQPSLLECFSATYPEAMRMNLPIVTTDLEYARGLCGDAAVYYSPLDASDAAEKLYSVATNALLRKQLIERGKLQLKSYDDYTQRSRKLISLCESICSKVF